MNRAPLKNQACKLSTALAAALLRFVVACSPRASNAFHDLHGTSSARLAATRCRGPGTVVKPREEAAESTSSEYQGLGADFSNFSARQLRSSQERFSQVLRGFVVHRLFFLVERLRVAP